MKNFLTHILGRGHPKLFFEGRGEVGEGVEARHPGNLAHIVLPFLQKICRTVQFVTLEEHGRILSGESLYLIVELGAGDFHHLRNLHNVQVGIGQFFLH